MLYDIKLVIHYDYATPAGGGRHLLRLLPAHLPGRQTVRSSLLTISPLPIERRNFTDFFGNAVTELSLPAGHDAVEFEARAVVDRPAQTLPQDDVALTDLPALLAGTLSIAPDAPHHFLPPSPRIPPDAAITAFARDTVAGQYGLIAMTEAMGRALHAAMTFDANATTVDTPPSEAFANRTGVCQDFAQIMIAGLRGMGIPAGYVSGYLRTLPPPGQPRLEGADAMHAWVRVWAGPRAGWIDYDPTNACFAGEDHVTVAHGRDYADVAPVAGVLRISGGQTSSQAVDMLAI
jgi:transglutaminase-like putative cysteine protease